MSGINKRERAHRLLYKAHLVMLEANGKDISDYKKSKAKTKARQILKGIKDLDKTIWNNLKSEFN